MLERLSLALVLAVGAATGLCGIGAGLPGPDRLRMFPPQLQPTPELARRFAEHWDKLYRDIKQSHAEMRAEEPPTYLRGAAEVTPGWNFFPDILLNSYRSFLLQSVNPDEKKAFVILSQMRPWKLDFQPLYVQYGGSFVYSLGAFLKAASLVGAVKLVPGVSHYLLHPEDMGRLYAAGRLFLVIFHLGTLWLLFDIGRRLGGWSAGFWAALLFAICPAVVLNVHIVKPHPFGAFWCMAAARYALLALEGGKKRPYLLSGACAGMAAGATYVYGVFAGAALLAFWARRRQLRAESGELSHAVGAGFLAAGVCLLTNLYLVIAFKEYLWETTVYVGPGRVYFPWAAGSVFARGMGAALTALVVAGLARPAGWRDPKGAFMRLMAVGGVVGIWIGLRGAGGFTGPMTIRFYHPMLALACLIAVDAVSRWPARLRALALCAVLVDSGLWSAVHLRNLRLDATTESTRWRAARWIEANIPAGATVGLIRLPEPAHTPPFRYDLYHLVMFEKPKDLKPERRPEYIVVSREGKGAVEELLDQAYAPAAVFSPWRAAWADPSDGSSFFNVDMYVYRRRS